MKTLKTTRFGEIEYKQEDIITFDKGIPGFMEEREFIVIQPELDQPLAFLQSILTPELSFVIANPFAFFNDYEFELDDQTISDLAINELDEVSIWGFISIQNEWKDATINLLGPIVINVKDKKGKQVILHETNYKTKTLLFPQPVKEGGR